MKGDHLSSRVTHGQEFAIVFMQREVRLIVRCTKGCGFHARDFWKNSPARSMKVRLIVLAVISFCRADVREHN
jgi:hypothetical protein